MAAGLAEVQRGNSRQLHLLRWYGTARYEQHHHRGARAQLLPGWRVRWGRQGEAFLPRLLFAPHQPQQQLGPGNRTCMEQINNISIRPVGMSVDLPAATCRRAHPCSLPLPAPAARHHRATPRCSQPSTTAGHAHRCNGCDCHRLCVARWMPPALMRCWPTLARWTARC